MNCPTVAGWSSQVARRAHNPKVAGSNPAPATHERPAKLQFARWLIQCKNTKRVSVAALAKEIGLATLRRAHVVVLVTTVVMMPHYDRLAREAGVEE